jgi:hypothetical protein
VKRFGSEITSGTRTGHSKKLRLNHIPRAPGISPWSPAKTTSVSSASPVSASVARTLPIYSST